GNGNGNGHSKVAGAIATNSSPPRNGNKNGNGQSNGNGNGNGKPARSAVARMADVAARRTPVAGGELSVDEVDTVSKAVALLRTPVRTDLASMSSEREMSLSSFSSRPRLRYDVAGFVLG